MKNRNNEITRELIEEAEQHILEEQKSINFDIKEFTVELLLMKFEIRDIVIPEYQRKFVWSEERMSKFIESVMMGLPIPYMFGSETAKEGIIEIVDGTQRLSALKKFIDNELVLKNLEKLEILNGFRFTDIPHGQQRKFKNKTLRMITLQNSDASLCFDIFERINTGQEGLRPSEVRKGAFRGPFYEMILKLAEDEKFNSLCPVSNTRKKRGEREELLVRFFAYSDKYKEFKHDVRGFLDNYIKEKNKGFDRQQFETRFANVLDFVEKYFPYGFKKTETASVTPRVRFEAIAVGVFLAISEKPELSVNKFQWLKSNKFVSHTRSDASNSSKKLQGRIEYVRDRLLGNAINA